MKLSKFASLSAPAPLALTLAIAQAQEMSDTFRDPALDA